MNSNYKLPNHPYTEEEFVAVFSALEDLWYDNLKVSDVVKVLMSLHNQGFKVTKK